MKKRVAISIKIISLIFTIGHIGSLHAAVVLFNDSGSLYEWNTTSGDIDLKFDPTGQGIASIGLAKYNPFDTSEILLQTRLGEVNRPMHLLQGGVLTSTNIEYRMQSGFDFITQDHVVIAFDANPGTFEQTFVSSLNIRNGDIVQLETDSRNDGSFHTYIADDGTVSVAYNTGNVGTTNSNELLYGSITANSMSLLGGVNNPGADAEANIGFDGQSILYSNFSAFGPPGSIRLLNTNTGIDQLITTGRNPNWLSDDEFLYWNQSTGTNWIYNLGTGSQDNTGISGVVYDVIREVPEPGSILLMISGFLALGFTGIRRSRMYFYP